MGMKRHRYVLVGTGGRCGAFLEPIVRDYTAHAELLAICDSAPTRIEYWQKTLKSRFGCGPVSGYLAKDFDRMLSEQRPDTVIVTVPDCLHADYIEGALKAGCDVICEKPLTTDAQKCRQILEAVERTGRKVRVAFNYRWIPINTKVKALLDEGLIGRVRHVSMVYALQGDHHGADYFRRWHSEKNVSGGLQVHKSTHHLDLINWWTDSLPERVYAQGRLAFFGRRNALERGDEAYTRYERYTGTASEGDPFRLDLSVSDGGKRLYLNAEAESGYVRDRNVFREGIDIEDTYDILIQTRCGIHVNYTLQAFAPYEGVRVWFVGDKGALELFDLGGSHIIMGQSNEALAAEQAKGEWRKTLNHYPLHGHGVALEVPTAEGSHGGGDRALFRDIFDPTAQVDRYGRGAGHLQGAASALVGIAANASMAADRPIYISELCPFGHGVQQLSALQ